MDRCHDCDTPITGGASCRKVEVPARKSFLGFLAGSLIPGMGQASYFQEVHLCATCAAARDAEASQKKRGGGRIFLAVLLGVLLLAILSAVYISRLPPPPTAASGGGR